MIVSMIKVTVNGDAQRFDAPLDVAALLARLDCKGRKVAVERNGEIVPRSAHGSTLIADGDRLEIVVAVGGGHRGGGPPRRHPPPRHPAHGRRPAEPPAPPRGRPARRSRGPRTTPER